MDATVAEDPRTRFQLGEVVEVLQRCKDLRGSWQPAAITLVKKGRREVEYFHIYKSDGERLRESFSVMRNSTAEWCKKYGSTVRGFLRPVCPQITSKEKKTWSKGFFVDVLMEDVWWEGVLLQKIDNADKIDFVNVLFPDANTNSLVHVKNLRLSHDWDEITGKWEIRGLWKGCPKVKRGRLTSWQESLAAGPRYARKAPAFSLSNRAERKQEYARLCEKRNEAKQFLFDAGYTIEFHQRIGRAREKVYVSPWGCRYYSLSRACNAWRRKSCTLPDDVKQPLENEVQEAFNLLEDTKCTSLEDTKCTSQDETGDTNDEEYFPNERYRKRKERFKLTFSPVNDEGRGRTGSVSPNSSVLDSSVDSKYWSLTRARKAIQCTSSCNIAENMCAKLVTEKTRESDGESFFPRKDIREEKSRFSIPVTAVLDDGSHSQDSVYVSPAGDTCYSPTRIRKVRQIDFFPRNVEKPENKEMKLLHTYNLLQEAQFSSVEKTGDLDDEDIFLKELSRKKKKLPKLSLSSRTSKGSYSPDSVLTEVTDSTNLASAVAGLERNEKMEEENMDSDDICSVCGEGGQLIICDHCPSSYHLPCVGLQAIPEGNWYCFSCSCTLCKSYVFGAQDGTQPYICSQCNNKYHADCIHSKKFPKMRSIKEDSWFCCGNCEKIHTELNRIVGISHPLGIDGLSWMLLRQGHSDKTMNLTKLSSAYDLLQECFLPMIDVYTGLDIILQALLSRRSSITRLNCTGFYTVILMKDCELLSVATIRIHGSGVAELPFVGTRFLYRRKGMCRHLISVIEKMLDELGVEQLILPATSELENTWKCKFSFRNIDPIEESEFMGVNLMRFPGTSLLKKYIPKLDDSSIENDWERARKFRSIQSIQLASDAMLSKDGNNERKAIVRKKRAYTQRRASCSGSRATVENRKLRKNLFNAEKTALVKYNEPMST